jgi:hypothetical protein
VGYAASGLAVIGLADLETVLQELEADPEALAALSSSIPDFEDTFQGAGSLHGMFRALLRSTCGAKVAAAVVRGGHTPAWLAARGVGRALVQCAEGDDALRLLAQTSEEKTAATALALVQLLPHAASTRPLRLLASPWRGLDCIAEMAVKALGAESGGLEPDSAFKGEDLRLLMPTVSGTANSSIGGSGHSGEMAIGSCEVYAPRPDVARRCFSPLERQPTSQLSLSAIEGNGCGLEVGADGCGPTDCLTALTRLADWAEATHEGEGQGEVAGPFVGSRKRRRSPSPRRRRRAAGPQSRFRRCDVGARRYDTLTFLLPCGTPVHAVGFVLEAHSDVLRDMLGMLRSVDEPVRIPTAGNLSLSRMRAAFLAAVDFCYTGEAEVMAKPDSNSDAILDVWTLGEYLQMDSLQRYCEATLAARGFAGGIPEGEHADASAAPTLVQRAYELALRFSSGRQLALAVAAHALRRARLDGAVPADVAALAAAHPAALAADAAEVMREMLRTLFEEEDDTEITAP